MRKLSLRLHRMEAPQGIRLVLLKSLLVNVVFLITVSIITYLMESPLAYLEWSAVILLVVMFPFPLLLYSVSWAMLFKPHTFKEMLWSGIPTALMFAVLYCPYLFVIGQTDLFSAWIDSIDVLSLVYVSFYPLFCFAALFVIWLVSTLILGICEWAKAKAVAPN